MSGISNQSNFITAHLQKFVAKQTKFFQVDDLDFLNTPVAPAALIADLMIEMGQTEDQIRAVLGDAVVEEILG